MEDVELTFHEDALRAIAKRAIVRKTGARGLRSIMEKILLDTMFELPALEGVREVVISDDVVEGKARPLYIYSERSEERPTYRPKRRNRLYGMQKPGPSELTPGSWTPNFGVLHVQA